MTVAGERRRVMAAPACSKAGSAARTTATRDHRCL